MIRAFLFGLAWFLILTGIVIANSERGLAGFIGLLLFGLPAAAAFWGARRARSNLSRGYAVLGWLLGFLGPIVVSWAAVGVYFVITLQH